MHEKTAAIGYKSVFVYYVYLYNIGSRCVYENHNIKKENHVWRISEE